MAALALSASGHVRLPNQAAHIAPSARRRVKKTRDEEEEEAAEEDVKKTDQIAFMQEDPTEEDRIFNPADSAQNQNGVETEKGSRSVMDVEART
ncbi:MAG: hypothetical protein ACYS5V_05610, partial [Planctomycetota bacterium]